MTEPEPIVRADGVTAAERHLKRLCDRTFLSLWSYPGVYRDQGGGKEVADLLAVFGDHLVIFSDKDCAYPDTGDSHADWRRWYRKAIAKSADQVFGAERWIKAHPDRFFLDRACTQPFPLPLPDPAAAKIHRVVVAHGVAERCRCALGGHGALMIVPEIEDAGRPFAVGQVDRDRGFVHVFDDATLDILMTELDTVADFVAYLADKERLILAGRLAFAASELDLLAHYLFPVAGKDRSRFLMPPGLDRLSIPAGRWAEFDRDPHRLARREANQISYLWDGLIEGSARSVIANTQYFATRPGIRGGAEALRIPAGEPRANRRSLAIGPRDFVRGTPVLPNLRAVRVVEPAERGRPHDAFLLISPSLQGRSQDEYRTFRRDFLAGLCDVVKLRFPDALDIVGIATELGAVEVRSQDIVYRDAREFTEQDRVAAEAFAETYGVLQNVVRSVATAYDYPDPDGPLSLVPFRAPMPLPPVKGRDRNKPCPCGSGKKPKRCCGLA